MTDLEKFVAVYKDFGIDIVVNMNLSEYPDAGFVVILGDPPNTRYDVTATYSDKFKGYGGFFSDIIFDKDGKFVEQGFWE